jgi:polysaccharide biosynthesis transport protein
MSESSRAGGRSGPESESLLRYYQILRERWWLIAACTLLVLVAAVVYVEVAPKTYTATAEMGVAAEPAGSGVLNTLPILQESGDPTEDVLTAANLVTTPQVAAAVVGALHLNESANSVLGDVSANPVGQASDVDVQVVASSPARAQHVANAFVNETIAVNTAKMNAVINRELPAYVAEMNATPTADRNGASGDIGDTVTQLRDLRITGDPTLSSIATATLPTSATSPKRKLTIVAGLIVGLALGICAAFAFHAFDPRLRREEQLRDVLGWPILARIPQEQRRHRTSPLLPAELSIAAQEGYRTLRTTLALQKGSADSRAYLVTGTGPGEGKSTTAINLAAAVAQTGASVILIEADLRRPTFAEAFGLSFFSGIEQVLNQEVDLSAALSPVLFGDVAIRVLAARRSGVELADRLSYEAAARLIEAAEALADYVVVDSPPLTAVIDALPFAQIADEIVVVARLDVSRLNKLTELDDLLLRHGAHPTGMVLVGETHPTDPYYGSYEQEGQVPAFGTAPRSGWPVEERRRQRQRQARADEFEFDETADSDGGAQRTTREHRRQ